MKVDLSELLSDLWRNRKTGLFSISVVDSNRLFKIFLKEGEIYRLSFGNLRGAGCLTLFDELDCKASFFLPSVELPGDREDIPPTSDLISLFKITGKIIDLKKQDATGSSLAKDDSKTSNAGGKLDALKAALVEQVGPAGIVVFKRIVEEKWKVTSPTPEDLVTLAGLLKAVIEDPKDRRTFVAAATTILSQ